MVDKSQPTSSAKFREGDVVRHRRLARQDGPAEFALVSKTSSGLWLMNDESKADEAYLTLLRRPVRVGDVLRYTLADTLWTITAPANGVSIPCVNEAGVKGGVPLEYLDKYEHADGTPIEPPAATDSKSDGHISEATLGNHEISAERLLANQMGYAQGAMAAQARGYNAICTVPEHDKWREKYERALAECVELRRRGDHIADLKQQLDGCSALVRDLQEERDFLKRELKRTDYRLWKARYGR